jgi:hypothetical protein
MATGIIVWTATLPVLVLKLLIIMFNKLHICLIIIFFFVLFFFFFMPESYGQQNLYPVLFIFLLVLLGLSHICNHCLLKDKSMESINSVSISQMCINVFSLFAVNQDESSAI